MPRSLRVIALTATLIVALVGGRSAGAQQSSSALTAGQQVLSRYLLSQGTIPPGLQQSADLTALGNALVAAYAQDPNLIEKIISRGRLDGLEQDLNVNSSPGTQIQLQLSLFRDGAGAAADVADPSLLFGLGANPIPAANFGDVSAAFATKNPGQETTNIAFAAGRVEVLVSEVGAPGSVNQADIIPATRLMESRTKLPAPPASQAELAVLQTQTSPQSILHDAYALLFENYLQKLPPGQLLGSAYDGALKALRDAGVTGLPGAPGISSSDEDQAWAQFLLSYQQLEKLVPASISARDLAYDAATEMYNNLNCHTTFFTPQYYARETADLSGSQEARIGILIQKFPNAPYTILRVQASSPAEQAGLKPGDQITAISHQTPEQLGEHFSDLFIGAEGTPITLTIQRPGQSQPFDVTIVRQLIDTTVEQHRVLPGGIGYIEFDDFTDGPTAVTMIQRALSDFQAAGNVNSWIMDLRYNGGGSEQTLSRVAAMFVPAGSLLTTDTEQDGTVSQTKAVGQMAANQKSMVLIIGQDTASAAEIFAQSLKDLGRVTLVGDTTSGCVNGGVPLGLLDGSGVFVSTIEVRAGPRKVALENKGVVPDVPVSLTLQDVQAGKDPQLDAAVALFRGATIAPQPTETGLQSSRSQMILRSA